MKTILVPPPRQEPCSPSPCGPNAQCRVVNDQAVCSCLPNYNGSPPNCRPECVVSSECPSSRACINNKCSDPCPNTCGVGAQCTTRNHNPICACPAGQTGDPFVRCSPIRKSFARWILGWRVSGSKKLSLREFFFSRSSGTLADRKTSIVLPITLRPECPMSNGWKRPCMFLLAGFRRISS